MILLAAPLNAPILRALADGAKQQLELRHEAGMPAQSTLRAALNRLGRMGAIEKRQQNRFPGTLEYELSAAGRDLLGVADAAEHWLERAPDGPRPLDGNLARTAIKALAEGWSTTILRALAGNPLSLTELDRVILGLSYPSLERRLAALRLAGQVEAQTGNGRGTPYGVTNWAREGIGPLVASASWERHHAPKNAPAIGRIDAEAIFMLATPLLALPAGLSGSCRMAVELPGGDGTRLAGVVISIDRGRVESCVTRLKARSDAWALGSVGGWLEALTLGDRDRIESGGDGGLVRAVLESLHRSLFERAKAAGR